MIGKLKGVSIGLIVNVKRKDCFTGKEIIKKAMIIKKTRKYLIIELLETIAYNLACSNIQSITLRNLEKGILNHKIGHKIDYNGDAILEPCIYNVMEGVSIELITNIGGKNEKEI